MYQSNEPEMLGMLLGQVSRLHHARAHQLFDAIGIYRGQPPVLDALWEKDGLTHTELATLLHVRPATISRMIQRMESEDFLFSKPDRDDQRISRVYLTHKGREFRSIMEETMLGFEVDTFANFTQEERVALRHLLLRVRENLLRVVSEPAEPPEPEESVAPPHPMPYSA